MSDTALSALQQQRSPSPPTSHSSKHPPASDRCALCTQPSKYTCPRCTLKTCSLACSKSHKTQSNCSGERDRAAYVPMNGYTWGTLADDYVFLEDVGRNVAGWGREIVTSGKGTRGRGGARGRGGGREGGGRRVELTPKCEALRVQLAARDIEIRFVPEGMEKRRLSQSVWDVRTKTAYLTVEFVFHLLDSDDGTTQNLGSKVSIVTHRNNLSESLFSLLVSHLKRKSDISPAILEFMDVSPSNPSVDASNQQDQPSIPPNVLFTISQLEKLNASQAPAPATSYQAPSIPIRAIQPKHPPPLPSATPAPPKPQRVFYPIDVSGSLQSCLRYRSFIEWPTIDVFSSREVFESRGLGVLVEDDSVAGQRRENGTGEGPNKRRKTETGLVQLVGGYTDESESEADRPVPTNTSAGAVGGIGVLGGYESDEIREADSVEEELGHDSNTPDS